MTDRSIMHNPKAQAALLRGMDLMAGLLRPTLGPVARTVAIGRLVGSGPPEILDSGATIARRTIEIPDPFENMGAMIVRHAAWRVFERVGDGTATAGVLVPALVREATRYVGAGGSPVPISRGIERGVAIALAELRRQARPIELPDEIAGLVAGIVRDRKLAEMIGEIVDSVGPDGAILVEDAAGTETTYEYIDGVRWDAGYHSPHLLKEGEASAHLMNPRIFVTDYTIETVEQLLPVVEACVGAGERSLLVITPDMRDAALSLLIVNRQRGVLDAAVAVKAPSIGNQRARILEDLAVITGGRCIREDAGESLADVTIEDLGRARQVWANRSLFGILGGQGDKAAIRQRIRDAKAELGQVTDDDYVRNKIKERIGKLSGAAARILVGAPTSSDQEELKLRVEAAVTTARAAVEQGAIPGGGAALVACGPALEAEAARVGGDEGFGLRALAGALAEPMRAIARNSGLDPSPILHEARCRGEGWTFDVLRREWVDAWEAGILDPLAVTLAAVETGASTAAVALTSDVLIHRKNPPTATSP